MLDEILEPIKDKMEKALTKFKEDLSRVRTGRANPDLLDKVTFEQFGQRSPVKYGANIVVEDAQTLVVKPFDKSTLKLIEKAIIDANIGINPITVSDLIRLPLPPLTQDRRKQLVSDCKKTLEASKISIRNIRRDGNNEFKSLEKDKEITKDESESYQAGLQKTTDHYIKLLQDEFNKKESELLKV